MVHFGTSGWRGIVGTEITFRKVRTVVRAIVDVMGNGGESPLLVAYDTRMLSPHFAETAAALATSRDVPVRVASRDVPAPALSLAVREAGARGGILFTGSHNAPEYSGLKLYTPDGTLAPEELTDRVEERYRELEPEWEDVFLPRPELQGRFDPKPAYLERLQGLIRWDVIRGAGLRVAVDPLFGSAREYLDHILLENGVDVVVIHNTRDPYFGGYAPNCTSEVLSRLRDVMRRRRAHMGLSTDGDADRFGILDQGARFKQSSLVLALILDYLARERGLRGGVGRTVATSHLIDAVAREHGLEVVETPVGFKSFGPDLVSGRLEFAAEESAGLAWARHLPERDGMLACLLALEMVAVEGVSLHELAQRLYARVGLYAYRRTQMPLTRELEARLEELLGREWRELDGRRVVEVDRRDGLKLLFEGGGWLMLRRARTEPKIRIHAEGRSREELRHLVHQARQLLRQGR